MSHIVAVSRPNRPADQNARLATRLQRIALDRYRDDQLERDGLSLTGAQSPLCDPAIGFPDPLPAGSNPFLVIQWCLVAAYAVYSHLQTLREEKTESLGRLLETEEGENGDRFIAREDDVNWRPVSYALEGQIDGFWTRSLSDARKLCDLKNIPLQMHHDLLISTERQLNKIYAVIQGVNRGIEFSPYNNLVAGLQDMADSTASAPHQSQQQTESAIPSPTAKPARSRKRIPLAEAEILVRNWLSECVKDDPFSVTRDAIAIATGVSTGSVSKTKAWRAFNERRKEEAGTVPREVPLTDTLQAALPNDCKTPLELAALMEEQEADEAEENRRHKEAEESRRRNRRHGPS
jgi:hypothetical protein